MTQWSKAERFQEFLKRLSAAPPADSGSEALTLLRDTLNEVEDQLSGIPYQPEQWQNDGRIYPPQEDNARDVPGRADLVRYRSRGHSTWIRSNGAMEIRDATGTIVLSKLGADGGGTDL